MKEREREREREKERERNLTVLTEFILMRKTENRSTKYNQTKTSSTKKQHFVPQQDQKLSKNYCVILCASLSFVYIAGSGPTFRA